MTKNHEACSLMTSKMKHKMLLKLTQKRAQNICLVGVEIISESLPMLAPLLRHAVVPNFIQRHVKSFG